MPFDPWDAIDQFKLRREEACNQRGESEESCDAVERALQQYKARKDIGDSSTEDYHQDDKTSDEQRANSGTQRSRGRQERRRQRESRSKRTGRGYDGRPKDRHRVSRHNHK